MWIGRLAHAPLSSWTGRVLKEVLEILIIKRKTQYWYHAPLLPLGLCHWLTNETGKSIQTIYSGLEKYIKKKRKGKFSRSIFWFKIMIYFMEYWIIESPNLIRIKYVLNKWKIFKKIENQWGNTCSRRFHNEMYLLLQFMIFFIKSS